MQQAAGDKDSGSDLESKVTVDDNIYSSIGETYSTMNLQPQILTKQNKAFTAMYWKYIWQNLYINVFICIITNELKPNWCRNTVLFILYITNNKPMPSFDLKIIRHCVINLF